MTKGVSNNNIYITYNDRYNSKHNKELQERLSDDKGALYKKQPHTMIF